MWFSRLFFIYKLENKNPDKDEAKDFSVNNISIAASLDL